MLCRDIHKSSLKTNTPNVRLSDFDHLELAVLVEMGTLAAMAKHPRNRWSVLRSPISDARHYILDCENCRKRESKQRTVVTPSIAFHNLELAVLVENRMVVSRTEHTRCNGQKHVRSSHQAALKQEPKEHKNEEKTRPHTPSAPIIVLQGFKFGRTRQKLVAHQRKNSR